MISFRRLKGLSSIFFVALAATGCGGEDAGSTNISGAAPSSASCNDKTYPDTMGYQSLLAKYKNEPQCNTQVQNAESYRRADIANCSGGDLAAATTQYGRYKTLVKYVSSIGCD